MPVFQLSEDPLLFPDPEWARPDGLLAVGGDLSTERLLRAYRLGIFPWYGEDEPILWWSPDPRCVLFPEEIRISRRLERRLRQQRYRVTCNQAFDQVVEACADVRIRSGQETWLIPEMQDAYRDLHDIGYAHSIEAWLGDELVGGLYGLAMGRFFFGESMFHSRPDASKVVLVTLAQYLTEKDFCLLDCQVQNEHLFSMGARNIPRQEFLDLLGKGCEDREECWGSVVLPQKL